MLCYSECDATITDPKSYIDQLNGKLVNRRGNWRKTMTRLDNLTDDLNLKSLEFANSCMMINCWNIIQDFHPFSYCKQVLISSNLQHLTWEVLYYQGESCLPQPNSCHSIILLDELSMCLVRIKLGSSEVDLSVRINCCVSTTCRVQLSLFCFG